MQSYYFFTKRRNKSEKKYQLYLLNVHSFGFSYVLGTEKDGTCVAIGTALINL